MIELNESFVVIVDITIRPNIEIRFAGQWFQAETRLHQNWMRDYETSPYKNTS